MDEFTKARYSRISQRYIEMLETEGFKEAIDMIYDSIQSTDEIKSEFIPFLKAYARERGYYV